MNGRHTLYFGCPTCRERYVTIEETDEDIYPGETYHCECCGDRVVIQVVSFEGYSRRLRPEWTADSADPNPAGSDRRKLEPRREIRNEHQPDADIRLSQLPRPVR